MDPRKWKKVLLHWITECSFMDHNYFNIEQTDFETFFQNYCLHLQYKGAATDLAQGSVDIAAFLQEEYPNFTPHLDENFTLNTADYVYVYSLLLHFSCVKYPDEYFHNICQKLSEQSQRSIAAFFKLLMECSIISRDTIRDAIADIAQDSPQSGNDSFSSGSGSMISPTFTTQSESLLRTPKHVATLLSSPSTPKSFLLQERTRELYNLRAQLETERYEKGLLEVQIKQHEDKIQVLNHDHRKLQQQMQELKNDILTKNAENHDSPKRDNDEQIKRRLCKEIAQKEQEIMKLTEILGNIREEKCLMQEKLNYAENQITLCMERFKQLDYKIDELSAELEQKNGTINYLTNNKLELEQFIAETRAAGRSARCDLNSSFDCLDSSISQASNSSGCQSSPENLARAVIDVQLREKELENQKLREALANHRVGNNRLAKHIQQTVQRHAEELELHIENVVVNDDECADPAEHFIMFSNYVDKLTKRFKNEQNMVQKLQNDALIVQKHNATMHQRVKEFERDVGEMKSCILSADKLNKELARSKKELEDKLATCEKELSVSNQQTLDTVDKFNMLSKEYEEHMFSCKIVEKDHQLNKLKADLLQQTKRCETLEATNQDLEQKSSDLKTKFNAMYEKLQATTKDHDLELKSLNEKLNTKEQQIKIHASAEMLIKDKYEKLLIINEDLKRNSRIADQHLDTMRNEIVVKEQEMQKLGDEIIELHKKNAELEKRIDTILESHKRELQDLESAINKKEQLLQAIHDENNKLLQQLEDVKQLNSLNRKETEKIELELKETTQKLNTIQMLLKSAEEEETNNVKHKKSERTNSLDELIERVKKLLKQRRNAGSKIECLELKIMELENKQTDSKERDKVEIEKVIEQNNNSLKECKNKLKVAEDRIQNYEHLIAEMKLKHNSFIKNVEKELGVHHLPTQNDNFEQLEKLQHKEEEHETAAVDYSRLENHLLLVINEYNNVKSKLLRNETEIRQLQEERYIFKIDRSEKMNDYSERIQLLEEENTQLLTDIMNFKKEHERTESLVQQANTQLETMSAELTEEKESKDRLSLKLQHKKKQFQDMKYDLETALEEKSSALENAAEQIKQLEKYKGVHGGKIEEFKVKVKKLTEEIEQRQKSHKVVCKQMETEQSEKATLLRSLEKTADQLKMTVDEKTKQTKHLQQRCADLEVKVNELSEIKEHLTKEMTAKATDWNLQQEDFEFQRDNTERKLKRKISELTEQQKANNLSLIEIITLLETIDKEYVDIFSAEPNLFETSDSGDETDSFNQLKILLNKFLLQLEKLQRHADEADRKRREAVDYADLLRKTNGELRSKISRSETEIEDLENILASENDSDESLLRTEVKRLQEDLRKMDCVNEKLSNLNADFQYKLTKTEEELANAKLTIEEQKKLITTSTTSDQPSPGHKNKISAKKEKIKSLEEELQAANASVNELQKQVTKFEAESSTNLKETVELSERVRFLLEEIEILKAESSKNKRAFEEAAARVDEECRNAAAAKADAAATKADAVDNEFKYNELNSKIQQLQADYDLKELHLQSAHVEQEMLANDVEALRSENESFKSELREAKRELQRALDNVTELIQQIGSIRLEKEAMNEENLLLRVQLDENSKVHGDSESKLQSIVDRSQSLEQSMLAAEKELKSLKENFANSEQVSEKLTQENNKLRELHEAATKRIEKLAVKLGDTQAQCSKLERDCNKLTKLNEEFNSSMEGVQREKEAIQDESRSLKERILKFERTIEDLMTKLKNVEDRNLHLEMKNDALELADSELKAKMLKLEKIRDAYDEKIRKLEQALNSSEQTNVRLNLEIGALNSQISEVRRVKSEERLGKAEEMQKKLLQSEELVQSYENRCAQLEEQLEGLRADNSHVSDELSKVALSLEATKEERDALAKEMQQLREDIEELSAAKERLHSQNIVALRQQEEYQRTQFAEQQTLVAELEAKVQQMQVELDEKAANFVEMEAETVHLRESLSGMQETNEQLENQRMLLSVAETLLEKEQNTTAQLRTDNQILQAKYKESKQRLIDANTDTENRIKETRLELEAKLDKMKNKMKSLYTEEVAKMKAKQEREVAGIKSELEVLKSQNKKYEDHIRKLSSQIVRLNDNILEYKKQIAILSSKLKHTEDEENPFKRPSATHIASSHLKSSTNIGSNLTMEDEEGEVFNNTYLTDLKNGRMSDYLSRNICPEELQYRNSLLPPHLQSTYAAQYDHGLMDDDIKDGPHSLDDSMSALLSNTVGGTRKKVSGATSYKRPGPPTPSKNGGRLSFGGSSEPPREILKETCEGNITTVTSTTAAKTPARFKMFSSRFSMGNSCIKDENTPPHRRRLSNIFKRK